MNWALLLAIIAFSIAISKKKKQENFWDKNTTDQVRGLAILMVVLGHLWVHVAKHGAKLIMSGDGVAIFLVLSGYGITKSLTDRCTPLSIFVARRINRVMLPYWLSTFGILLLDYLILNRIYPISHVFLSLIGVNLFGIMHHFDYVRWFITFQLFWYIAAVTIYRGINFSHPSIVMLGVGSLFFFLDYYILKFGWYQFFAFPVGCLIADKQMALKLLLSRVGKKKTWCFFLLMILAFLYLKSYVWTIFVEGWPSVCVRGGKDLISVIFSLSLIGLLDISQTYSRFLIFCGKFSYQIFLLHGVFLVKYNPFFQFFSLPIAFVVYLAFIFTISWIMEKCLHRIKWPVKI